MWIRSVQSPCVPSFNLQTTKNTHTHTLVTQRKCTQTIKKEKVKKIFKFKINKKQHTHEKSINVYLHNIPLLRANKNKRRTNFKTSVNKQQTNTNKKKELKNHNKHLRKQSLLNVSVNLGQNNYLNAFKTTQQAKQTTEETQPRNARVTATAV